MMTEKLGGYDVHPRHLMDETGFDNLRALYQTDTDFKKLADAIISNADVYATQSRAAMNSRMNTECLQPLTTFVTECPHGDLRIR